MFLLIISTEEWNTQCKTCMLLNETKLTKNNYMHPGCTGRNKMRSNIPSQSLIKCPGFQRNQVGWNGIIKKYTCKFLAWQSHKKQTTLFFSFINYKHFCSLVRRRLYCINILQWPREWVCSGILNFTLPHHHRCLKKQEIELFNMLSGH